MSKKLTLSTQTLRTLSGSDLDRVAGGVAQPTPRPVPRPYSQWNSCGIVCMAGPCD